MKHERIDDMYTVILNPTAGRGTALKRLPEIEQVLCEQGLSYRVEEAADSGESTRIARNAVEQKYEGVVAVGGDGSLLAVVNALAGSDVPMIFVPCGTGNDFARCLNLPKDPIDALKLQLKTPVTRIDVGMMNNTCFLNISGTGFDVDVLRVVGKYKERYKGILPYLLGLIEAIKDYRPTTAMISVDDGELKEATFAILSLGNGIYMGGGMKACPDAKVNDGLFDLIIVDPVKKCLIPILVAFYIAGKHVSLGVGKLIRCKKFRIVRKGMTINMDGELSDADVAEYRILPGALAVRISI